MDYWGSSGRFINCRWSSLVIDESVWNLIEFCMHQRFSFPQYLKSKRGNNQQDRICLFILNSFFSSFFVFNICPKWA
jgi:hypothetical protein